MRVEMNCRTPCPDRQVGYNLLVSARCCNAAYGQPSRFQTRVLRAAWSQERFCLQPPFAQTLSTLLDFLASPPQTHVHSFANSASQQPNTSVSQGRQKL